MICCILGLFLLNSASVKAAGDPPPESKSIHVLYDSLRTLALDHSPDIRIARNAFEQKKAEEYSSKAKRWSPNVDLELSQRRIHNLSETSAGTDSDENESNWKFVLDWPVYRRSLVLQAEENDLETELAETTLTIKTEELDVELRTLLADYLVKVYRFLNLQNSIALSRDHLKGIRTGYEMRQQTKLQLLRAQANLKILEVRKDIDLQRKKESFRNLIRFTGLETGHPIFTDLNAFVATEKNAEKSITELASLDKTYHGIFPWLEPADETTLHHQFVSESPLYKKIVLEKRIAHARAKTLMQTEWPDLSVKGRFQKRDDTELTYWDTGASIGVFLTVPLFSGGTAFSNYRAKNEAEKIALTTEEDHVRKIFFSTLNDRKLILELKNALEKQKIQLQQQEEIVRLSVKSYTLKKTSMQDLLTSWNTLIDAKNDLMQTTSELGTTIKRYIFELGLIKQGRL